MTSTDLTHEELSLIVYRYAGSLPFMQGYNLVSEILALQAAKQSQNPEDVYARLLTDSKEEAQKYLVLLSHDAGIVSDFANQGKKIQAIKELRTLAKCGLKEAKDAIESAYPTINSSSF